MGRRKTGAAPYSIRNRAGVVEANTTVGGDRYRESLGIPWRDDARGTREARKAAEAWYQKIIQGRVVERHARITTSHTAAELVAKWLAHIDTTRAKSASMFNSHGRRILDVFTDVRALFADDAPQLYADARLKEALRRTVQKELSSLRNFYAWCKLRCFVASMPASYDIPPSETGKRTGNQRQYAVEITDAEARAIIAALPEWTAPRDRWRRATAETPGAYRVRAFFLFAYETGLRPSTLRRLEAPMHWARGRTRLTITDEIDKASFGRRLPLSKAALAVLRECAPAHGPIFGDHDYRKLLRPAAVAVLGEERGRAFARYDFRHARATHALERSNDILGVGFLLGHRLATTTNRYLHSSEDHAERVVRLAELGTD